MRKFLILLTALCLLLALAGCDPLPPELGGPGNRADNASSSPIKERDEPIAADEDVILPEDGYAEGFLGDAVRTVFFDFTVNDAYLTTEYEGYTPSGGNTLLVADVTIYNYTTYSVPMYDTDFQAQWGYGDDDFAVPVTYARDGYPNTGVDAVGDMFPAQFDVGIHKSARGMLVFEVPEGYVDFSISFQEYYGDGSLGDLFFVYFTPDVKDASL